MIPTTLDNAVELLISKMSKEDIEEVKSRNLSLISHHFSIGMQLRNEWGLWSGSELRDFFFDLGIFHADDMSAIILTKAEKVIRGEQFDFEKEKARYDKHWADLGINPEQEIEKLKKHSNK